MVIVFSIFSISFLGKILSSYMEQLKTSTVTSFRSGYLVMDTFEAFVEWGKHSVSFVHF